VTVNYRVGTLGFMSTSNDDLPANLGLWDQNLAMKWVQTHIQDFGGDPKKVWDKFRALLQLGITGSTLVIEKLWWNILSFGWFKACQATAKLKRMFM